MSKDLDATIKAFEILSDRVSNVEEHLLSLVRNARFDQMCKFGHISGTMFGFTPGCDILLERDRKPDPGGGCDDPGGGPFRHSGVIMRFEFSGKDCDCHKWNPYHNLPEDPSYYEAIEKETQVALLCSAVHVESFHKWLDEEALERYLLQKLPLPRNLKSINLLHVEEDNIFSVSILSKENRGSTLDVYLDLARTICRQFHARTACWEGVTIFPIWPLALRHHRLSAWLKFNDSRDEYVKERDRGEDMHDRIISYLMNHPFWREHVGTTDNNWE